jgi:radical SAM superfamily enzyme YgiQ (UPF0313 family)
MLYIERSVLKVRLTLAGIASQYIHQSLAPWCLKAGLRQYGVKAPCRVLELNINQPHSQALEALVNTKPQLVGFSCYIWNISMVRSLAASLKLLLPNTVIVLGGPEAGSRPKEILKELPQADYVISGPGEYAFAELVRRLDEGENISDIPGLSFRFPGEEIQTNPPVPLPLDPPSPYTKECVAAVQGRIAYVETSRGCPFHCAFCLSGREDKVTFLPLDRAKRDLLKAAASGTRTVKLTDRTFNCDRERARKLFRFLLRKHREGAFSDVCFHFEEAADLFDDKTLALLRTAPKGLFQMEAGLQSFHKETLEACQRKTDLTKLSRNIAMLLVNQNIHQHVDLIAGLPFEDLKTFGDSFNKAFALKANMLQLGFLKLLPGSPLFEQREEYGIVHSPEPPYEILQNKWLSYQDICLLKRCEQAVERLYNNGKFRFTLNHVTMVSGLTPFQLFCRSGDLISAQPGGLSLDRLTELAFSFFLSLPNVRRDVLRELMAWDRLVSDNTGRLPACLQIPDPRLAPALAALRREYPAGAKLGAFIMYRDGEKLFWADYSKRDPVTGAYAFSFRPLADFL